MNETPTDDAPAEAPTPDDFQSLGLSDDLAATLAELGYQTPTDIQKRAIPVLLEGRDVLGSAATGTGKTAAFSLPLVERIDTSKPGVRVLIVAPTRELAVQVAEAFKKYGAHRRLGVVAIYGGSPYDPQFRALKRGTPIVVGTPGRLIDHLERGSLDLSGVETVVLDEADEMLDMGFTDAIDTLLKGTPKDRQTALFSATFPPRIEALARRHLTNPERIAVRSSAAEVGQITQVAYTVSRHNKAAALARILNIEAPTAAVVFCRRRADVDGLTEQLGQHGFRARALHGGLSQGQRDRVMGSFRDGSAELLIATDVAARGLDVNHVTHVINFDLPSSPDVYVHRIGRTGRAGRKGTAITLVEPRDRRKIRTLERITRQKVEDRAMPTVDDLRAAERGRSEAALREALAAGPAVDAWRILVDDLIEEGFDAAALAATGLELWGKTQSREPNPRELSGGRGNKRRDERPPRDAPPRRDAQPRREERPRREEQPRREERYEDRGPRERRGDERDARGQAPGRGPRGGGYGREEDRGREGVAPRPAERAPERAPERYDNRAPERYESRPPARHDAHPPARHDDRGGREERGDQGDRGFGGDGPPRRRDDRQSESGMTRLFMTMGSRSGLQAGDLVGAISGGLGIPAAAIGAIRVTERYTRFEVASDLAERVLSSLRETGVRGRVARVDYDRHQN